MAAVWSGLEPDDFLTRGHSEQSLSHAASSSVRRKRFREGGLDFLTTHQASSGVGCEQADCLTNKAKKPVFNSMAQRFHIQGFERNISAEVSALRLAAAAAVAEFNGPLGPGAQLTAPDNSHEIGIKEGSSNLGRGDQKSRPGSFRSGADSTEGYRGGKLNHLDSLGPSDSSFSTIFTQHGCPPHGAKAICGRRPRMEDAYTAVPFLLEVPVPGEAVAQSEILPPRIAPVVQSASGSPAASDTEGSKKGQESDRAGPSRDPSTHREDSTASSEPYLETLHFFGVFDGHGGAEAALHCAQTLHQRIAEALAETIDSPTGPESQNPGNQGGAEQMDIDPTNLVNVPSVLPAVLPSVVEDTDFSSDVMVNNAMEEQTHEDEKMQDGKVESYACNSASFESALTSAFNRTDEEFGKEDNAALVGTTAVVALVGSRQLYVANCGDSRAVLCRAGVALPLTDDHKAAREDESARVEAAGGQILFWNGIRVMGVLAVSRAIGDHCLRPYVIAQPEVTILARRPDDELLLLASDGLWDVLSNQVACTLAQRCLRRARQRGASRQSAARIAATVLTRAAVDKGSRDNVTVLVVDLSTGGNESDEPAIARTQSTLLAEAAVDHTHEHDPEERLARMQSQNLKNLPPHLQEKLNQLDSAPKNPSPEG